MAALLADENVSRRVVDALRQAGHAVEWVAETMPGATDEEVLAATVRNNRVLVTSDRNFGEMVVRRKSAVVGIVMLALDGMRPRSEAERVVEALPVIGERLIDAIVVLEPARIRLRPLRPGDGQYGE